ncbi:MULTISPECIES: Uma2 family endonuclease [unclassified Moorena]|uniref:Uma2 family endonuclease n=1 Tax=unclassified Moorena TaxID=2683338 RepID=UPI001401B9C4|nr:MULTISPECIES: Uma2 family endonuclease [unclassified Moorena]NEO14894.1 Uma2 family endonuclease [Moorena sp. SIO3E8]NEQ00473.1 Uma2 family endonuclease [Moorena sp. SIO3F7]
MSSKLYPLLKLIVPPSLDLNVSHQQFEQLANANRDLRLERTAEGKLIVNPPTGWETGKRNLSITRQLGNWYEENPEKGEAFDSSTGFELPNGSNRSPDSSWVSRHRWDALTEEQKQTFPKICPNFVIELRSKSDSLKELRAKMQEYIDNDLRLGWLIDPQNQRVEIYRSGQKTEIIDNPNELSGEAVLPGFKLKLQGILT